MEIFTVSTEREILEFCYKYRPKKCCKFKIKGKVAAAWVVIAGVGELYTKASIKKPVGKPYLLVYDFHTNHFKRYGHDKKESSRSA